MSESNGSHKRGIDMVIDAEINAAAKRNEIQSMVQAGGRVDEFGCVHPPVKKNESKFFKGGSAGSGYGGVPGELWGEVPEAGATAFKKEIVEDMYHYSRSIGFHFTSLDLLTVFAGIEAYKAFPPEMKDTVRLSTGMEPRQFRITKD